MNDPPANAAALILDENGVWLRVPRSAWDDLGRPIPRHVLAARELALRLARPDAVEDLAVAFERRLACQGANHPLDGLRLPETD